MPADAEAIATLRIATAETLTERHGRGHWSGIASVAGQLARMRNARVYVAKIGRTLVGTWTLATRKPWAIDRAYFTPCRRPLYLTDMAVLPARQGGGIGRACLAHAERVAREWPADAICLDAYDSPAGAGEFYRRCGYREVGRASYRGVPLIYYEHLLV